MEDWTESTMTAMQSDGMSAAAKVTQIPTRTLALFLRVDPAAGSFMQTPPAHHS
jgi:hypothetical protein